MDVEDFRKLVIAPSLKIVDMWSLSSEILMLGTALTESNLHFLKQRPGVALGVCQMEPDTYKDCVRYLNRPDKRRLKYSILAACYMDIFPGPDALIWNLRLSVIMARIKYFMDVEPLPEPNDIVGHAKYWKRVYNSPNGAGTIEQFIDSWNRYAGGH